MRSLEFSLKHAFPEGADHDTDADARSPLV